ncbi:MAG: hypothetical protein M3R30_00565 [Candidatus Eremiobacteraeota bacterium]|nr:hypothetical protein [Candidatus Eremiobacteraeota bacterium]
MKRIVRTAVAVALAIAFCVNLHAPANASSDLLARMIALNPGLKSYTAAIHAEVHMTSFPFLSPVLDGTYYHKDPSKDKIVFTSGLPGIAKQFSKIYPRIAAPVAWKSTYVVTTGATGGTTTTFRLAPRKNGRIDHVDVVVDNATATILSMKWNYNDGSGYAEMHQTYTKVGNDYLVSGQTGHVEQSIYKADITSTFASFKLNDPIADSVFTDN